MVERIKNFFKNIWSWLRYIIMAIGAFLLYLIISKKFGESKIKEIDDKLNENEKKKERLKQTIEHHKDQKEEHQETDQQIENEIKDLHKKLDEVEEDIKKESEKKDIVDKVKKLKDL